MLVDSETNSIYALRKDLLKYFKNPEEAKNLGLMSEKKIKLVCPDCGHETEMMVQNFTRRGFYCKYCKKDGVSFPNKILRGLLKQLKFYIWVYGVVVSRSLCMRKASGSIPDISSLFICLYFFL